MGFLSQEPEACVWWERLAGTRPRRPSNARLRSLCLAWKWLGVINGLELGWGHG